MEMKSEERQVFISHASEDKNELEAFIQPLNYLPLHPYIAINKQQVGWLPGTIQEELDSSKVIIPYLTKNSEDNRWVNQEIGYAMAQETNVIPVFESSDALSGLISNVEGVPIDRENPHETTFGIISRLREIFAPLPDVVSDWYLEIRCVECGEFNIFPINRTQQELRRLHREENLINRTCSHCRTYYQFDPRSLHLLSTEDRE